jgi:hypothetical protein
MKKLLLLCLLCCTGCASQSHPGLEIWVSQDTSDKFVEDAVIRWYEDGSDGVCPDGYFTFELRRHCYTLRRDISTGGVAVVAYTGYKPEVLPVYRGVFSYKTSIVLEKVKK